MSGLEAHSLTDLDFELEQACEAHGHGKILFELDGWFYAGHADGGQASAMISSICPSCNVGLDVYACKVRKAQVLYNIAANLEIFCTECGYVDDCAAFKYTVRDIHGNGS
jgi:hypothetical protein